MINRYIDKGVLKITTRSLKTKREHTYSIELADWKLDALHPKPLENLGIIPSRADAFIFVDQYAWLEAISKAFSEFYHYASFNELILYKLITQKLSLQSLAGPLTLFKSFAITFKQGIGIYLSFLAVVSIAVAVFNCLPLPGLDGGQLLYLVIEYLRGRPLSIAFQVLAFRLSVIVLVVLLFQLLINDILRWLIDLARN